MKKIWLMIGLAAAVTTLAGLAVGSDASVEKGRKLFNDPGLGGSQNSTSCNTCHPDGRGLEDSGVNEDLADMINMCIERPLKGKALDSSSTEMKALQLYIKSLDK